MKKFISLKKHIKYWNKYHYYYHYTPYGKYLIYKRCRNISKYRKWIKKD